MGVSEQVKQVRIELLEERHPVNYHRQHWMADDQVKVCLLNRNDWLA
jgi:hypothetical protein